MNRYLVYGLLSGILLLLTLGLFFGVLSSVDSVTEPTAILSEPTVESPAPETTVPELTDPPLQFPEPEDTEFVRIADYIVGVKVALAYATVNNVTQQRIYDFTDAYLRYGTVKKLKLVNAELRKQGIGLIIWDAFRPADAQKMLLTYCSDQTCVFVPETGEDAHCKGHTLDISLYNLNTGAQLPVPAAFGDYTDYGDRDYSDCDTDAAANARLLEQLMKKYGFVTCGDRWHCFMDETDYSIEEFFNPVIPSRWVANCTSYISLRNSAGNVIERVPAGSVVCLEGWRDKYAKVKFNGKTGYVLSNYLMPEREDYLSQCLLSVVPTDVYTYEQMLLDIDKMAEYYPTQITVSAIGRSELGREIPVIRIGDSGAQYHILLQGAMHGREHMTAWLLMAMIDYWLSNDILSYGDICYHVIPMMNPDGVTISQTGVLNELQKKIYLTNKKAGITSKSEELYAISWKANAMGVDLNRNFPAGWERIDDRVGPASQKYKGTEPFSAAETAALRDYTFSYNFDATISYHSSGSIIYYNYGNKKEVNRLSESLALQVEGISGYSLIGSGGVDAAGYSDWIIDRLEKPALTIEIGCEDSPLSQREIYSIFARNILVLPTIARWLQTH